MSERGLGSVEWVLGIALMLLPIAGLVLSFAPFFERSTALSVAVQSAARAVVLANDDTSAENAVATIEDELAAAFCTDDCVDLYVTPVAPSMLQRGGWVVARGEMASPGIAIPFVGTFGPVRYEAVHREPVDPYRSLP